MLDVHGRPESLSQPRPPQFRLDQAQFFVELTPGETGAQVTVRRPAIEVHDQVVNAGTRRHLFSATQPLPARAVATAKPSAIGCGFVGGIRKRLGSRLPAGV